MPLTIRCSPSNDRNALLHDTTARGVAAPKSAALGRGAPALHTTPLRARCLPPTPQLSVIWRAKASHSRKESEGTQLRWPHKVRKHAENTRVASSDDADAHHATNARSCGSPHSCRWTHCFDQARSNLWSVYHEGSHSRFAGVLRQPGQAATRVTGAGDCAVACDQCFCSAICIGNSIAEVYVV